jgi:electron transfer flavoprotein beta subunit
MNDRSETFNRHPTNPAHMQILVTVAEVAAVDDEFEIDGLAVDERFLTYDLNEWDEYAVEEAVQYKEDADDEVEVVTVTIGPERSEETIRQALAKGADRGVRIWDETLGERPLEPALKTALVAEVAEQEDPDIVLSGVQTGDDSWSSTGVACAERLGWEWAAVVNQLELDMDGGVANVHRELEGGLSELTEVDLPAVLTIQTGINEPRYASLRGIRQAQNKPLDVLDIDDLGVDVPERRLDLQTLIEPEAEGEAQLFEGSPEETATDLAELLRDQGVEA